MCQCLTRLKDKLVLVDSAYETLKRYLSGLLFFCIYWSTLWALVVGTLTCNVNGALGFSLSAVVSPVLSAS